MNAKIVLNENNKLFSYQTKVRIDDINFGNHLCHSKYIPLIHNARALFLKNYQLSELNCFGLGLIMLNLSIQYRNQCFFDDNLLIYIYCQNISKRKIEFAYSIQNMTQNNTAALALTEMGFYDFNNKKLGIIPNEFENLLNSQATINNK